MIVRIYKEKVEDVLKTKLVALGFESNDAETLARVFVKNSLQGVYSHGINRFCRFVRDVNLKVVNKHSKPILKYAFKAIQQWDGQQGPGILNAMRAVNTAMDLSDQFGIGCVSMANTNHWMRGGTYGRIAAEKGHVFIGWTNTTANLPAWGAKDCKLGNNPLVMAAPGDHPVIIDMAMSQYSYGKLEDKEIKGEGLLQFGGYDSSNRLSKDPASILASGRPLPIGYWKGAGLSLLLDILATILSDGLSTAEISQKERETAVSQVFICINAKKLAQKKDLAENIASIIDDYKLSIPMNDSEKIIYPGERTEEIELENLRTGIPIPEKVWEEVINLPA